jgi:hypothetical protein
MEAMKAMVSDMLVQAGCDRPVVPGTAECAFLDACIYGMLTGKTKIPPFDRTDASLGVVEMIERECLKLSDL